MEWNSQAITKTKGRFVVKKRMTLNFFFLEKCIRQCFIIAVLAICVTAPGQAETAEEKIRVGIVRFDSKASGVSPRQAEIITDIFTGALVGSQKITLLERQQIDKIGAELRIGQSGLVDSDTAAEIGKLAGLQYMLMGSVTELNEKVSKSELPIGDFTLTSITHEARTTIDIRVIDVATGETRFADRETGYAKESASDMVIDKIEISGVEFGGLSARAIEEAAFRLSHRLRSGLVDEYSQVIDVEGNEILIDAGTNTRTKEGMLYLVFADGDTVRDRDGNAIAKKKIPLAVLKVKDVENAYSTCSVAEPSKGDVIKKGDKIEPILPEVSKNMKFPKKRPVEAEYKKTFDQIFSEEAPASGTAESKPSKPKTTETAEARVIEGFDPNHSTDAKVLETLVLTPTDRNELGIRHRGAWNMYSQKKYKEAFEVFVVLAEDYGGNYLSAYWAGMSAMRLNSYKEAVKWFDKALEINKDYSPAAEGKTEAEKMLSN
jgi:curli biogenesis system outer membrane secretion channel CsgG